MSAHESVHNGTHTLYLGPGMRVFVASCLDNNPTMFWATWATAGPALMLTLYIATTHILSILKRPVCLQRMYYLRISWFAPVLGVTAALTLLSPRSYPFQKMLQTQFEAISIGTFGIILCLLLAEEARHALKDENTDGMNIAAKIMRALHMHGPRKYFGVPPFGCCFRPLMKEHFLEPWHLLMARNFFRQYAFMVVIVALLSAWLALTCESDTFFKIKKILGILMKLSGFVALYGLFILYAATHDLLEHWRTTAKFVSIKLVVLLSTYQELMVGPILKKLDSKNGCFDTPHYHGEMKDMAREHYWNMYFTCLESAIVAFLVSRAFPADEVKDFEEEYHVHLIEMKLSKMQEEGLPVKMDSSSDSDENGGEENGV